MPGHFDAQFERFGSARASNQEKRLLKADVKTAEIHDLFPSFTPISLRAKPFANLNPSASGQ
jgi:hypothetical protein